MDDAKKYHIEKDDKDETFLLLNSNGNIEYEVMDFEPNYNPRRLVVRDLDKNNRIPIDYDLVENIYTDYPEYCV